ncbi:MAG: M1 family metallopeptidase [Deltaproteobacteria bacterium]|nr:M1 family metallopeptidase [Deltaproteobacteria bacterium]
MARLDPHSCNDAAQPEVTHLDWKARVDFAARVIEAEATLELLSAGQGPLDLDTRELTVHGVFGEDGAKLAYSLAPAEPVLGSRLRIELPAGTRRVRIAYRTSPQASALQWLTPAQTAGGKQPFLFSQCQSIHARSVVPLQDTPRVRIRFRAEVRVPKALRVVMAAGFVRREEQGDEAVETFEMPQAIPPYLLALAAGELVSRDVGPRSRVWAEPSVVEKAAWEFGGVDAMLLAAEKLFGPYEWDRFDVLTMPPSFPYGGMENPRLTFLTPTLLAGDRSLVNVLAHELAHSWTGNLVTNANANHFWLNEGFTVWAERRIQEALSGADVAGLHAALGRRGLEKAIAGFKDHPEWTRLRTDFAGVDPDEAYSEVPYEKGFLFLRAIEEVVGRPAFDAFLRKYLDAFRFRSITTEDFTALVDKELPGVLAKVNAQEWIDGPGVPANAPLARSARLEALQALGTNLPADEVAKRWTPTEWSLYLESLPHPSSREACAELDRRFSLGKSGNYEVLVSWLSLAASSGFEPAVPRVEEVLGKVGRMKYLKPLYTALATNSATRENARRCFEKHKDSYHPIAQQVIAGILKKNGA